MGRLYDATDDFDNIDFVTVVYVVVWIPIGIFIHSDERIMVDKCG